MSVTHMRDSPMCPQAWQGHGITIISLSASTALLSKCWYFDSMCS